VKTTWLGEQKAQAWEKAYKDMRAKYTVLLPAPPDIEKSSTTTLPTTRGNSAAAGKGAQ
jgi:hypothetical protein